MNKLVPLFVLIALLFSCAPARMWHPYTYRITLIPQPSGYRLTSYIDTTLKGMAKFKLIPVEEVDTNRYCYADLVLMYDSISMKGDKHAIRIEDIDLDTASATCLPRSYDIQMRDLRINANHLPLIIGVVDAKPNTVYVAKGIMGRLNCCGFMHIRSVRPLSKTELAIITDNISKGKPVELEQKGIITISMEI